LLQNHLIKVYQNVHYFENHVQLTYFESEWVDTKYFTLSTTIFF